ncbi:hypothetical protein ASC77_14800 [Nocardioides sp. Root1257]|nr:hypothetical protein ASC77_14800 [Nocardioides sp. Root1257]KRC44947.1 hypothetical protein ASE24_15750 [Nocardioides sp. Root224]
MLAALSVTTPALLALSATPASAGTSSGSITCTNPPGTPAGTPDAPFDLSVVATPPSTAPASGGAYAVTGDLTVTVPGTVVGGFVAMAGSNAVGFAGGRFALDATHTTGTLTTPNLGAKPSVPITNYDAGTKTADPISFTFTGVTFSGATVAGASGDTVAVSLSSNQAASGLALSVQGSLNLTLGWGTADMGPAGTIQPTGGSCAAVGAPFPSLGSTTLDTSAPLVLTSTAKPKVVGTAKVGKTLTCKPGSWSPAPTTTTFQWLRDGKAIKKAAKARYKVVKADARHRLSCRVSVGKTGYRSATATSAPTKKVTAPKKR